MCVEFEFEYFFGIRLYNLWFRDVIVYEKLSRVERDKDSIRIINPGIVESYGCSIFKFIFEFKSKRKPHGP